MSDLTVGADGKADKVLIAEQGLALHLLVPRSERVGQAFHLVSGNNYFPLQTNIEEISKSWSPELL